MKKQLAGLRVDVVNPDEFQDALEEADVVLDAIFGEGMNLRLYLAEADPFHSVGFSFKGEPRDPYRESLEAFNNDVSSTVMPSHAFTR